MLTATGYSGGFSTEPLPAHSSGMPSFMLQSIELRPLMVKYEQYFAVFAFKTHELPQYVL